MTRQIYVCFTLSILISISLILISCQDMPEIIAETKRSAPQLSGGPYIILGEPGTPEIVRLRSTTPCIPGIRAEGEHKRVRRYGRSNTQHEINISSLLDNKPVQVFDILLDDYKRATMKLKNPLAKNTTVIGFLGGGSDDISSLTKAASMLAAQNPDAVVLTGGSFPLNESLKSWDNDFFNPIKNLTLASPLFLLPEDRKLLPAGAGSNSNKTYWSRDMGNVHLIFLEIDSLKNPSEREQALSWLQQDLANNPLPWSVLCLSKPLFGATRIHARAVETLGVLLESGGIDLVISGGAKYYHRTLPVQASGKGAVRYIVTGGVDGGQKTPAGREYRAAISGLPHISYLTATENMLSWKAMPVNGLIPIDEVTVMQDGSSAQGEPTIEKMDILTDALSALTLQREVLTIARQAAKALKNTKSEQDITFTLANPSPTDIKGELIWNIPADSAWKINPEAIKFSLKSGYEGAVKFRIKPYMRIKDASMPELIINIQGIGSARQNMIITNKKEAKIFPLSGNIMIDGIMAENAWDETEDLQGFKVLGNNKDPKQPFKAKVAYDDKGIYIVARCAANDPDKVLTSARKHDDAIHKDESVEIFIDPRGAGREYYQFAVNVKGVKLERSSQLGLAWNPRWDAKVSRRRNYYTIEAFIPYQALGLTAPPKNGDKWLFNITRNDYQASAVKENPFIKQNEAAKKYAGSGINRFNIGELAEQELGKEVTNISETKDIQGPGFEVVQWANTYGPNSRSGLYGDIIFSQPTPANK